MTERLFPIEVENTNPPFLYKGLNAKHFDVYFAQGGVAPYDPVLSWLTDSWQWANRYAMEYGDDKNNYYCFGVIDASVLDRGNLKTLNMGTRNNYYGEERIRWTDFVRIFVAQGAYDQIKRFHKESPNEIEWNFFDQLLEKVPQDLSNFQHKINTIAGYKLLV